MNPNILNFFTLHRTIFGVCPISGEFFRLSDCQIFLKSKPVPDWMDKVEVEEEKLDKIEEVLEEKQERIREKAREKGKQLAQNVVKKIDTVFTPRKLNPDDTKVIFHPVDYIVFNGMNNSTSIKNIVILDREIRGSGNRTIQKSIERTIERENYEWQTIRMLEDGSIKMD